MLIPYYCEKIVIDSGTYITVILRNNSFEKTTLDLILREGKRCRIAQGILIEGPGRYFAWGADDNFRDKRFVRARVPYRSTSVWRWNTARFVAADVGVFWITVDRHRIPFTFRVEIYRNTKQNVSFCFVQEKRHPSRWPAAFGTKFIWLIARTKRTSHAVWNILNSARR